MDEQAITEFRWNVEDLIIKAINGQGDYFTGLFSLNDKPEAKFKVFIRNGQIQLQCKDVGQAKEFKLSVNVVIEIAGVNVKERVKQCIFTYNNQFSDPFFTKSELADLKKLENSVIVCLKIKHGDSISGVYDEGLTVNKLGLFGADIGALKAFASNISMMYSDGHFDLTIHAGDTQFKALKLVLMSHSEVFKAMFLCPNWTESKTDILKIDNIRPEVVDALIKWMHFLTIDNIDNLVEDLFKAAHMYEKACVKSMIKSLSSENLISRIIMSYIYDIEDLKTSIIQFVKKDTANVSVLIESDKWFEFSTKYRDLSKKFAVDI